MFREMHHADRGLRELDLAEKMAERRRQSLAAARRPSPRARIARMLFALAVSAEGHEARRMAREGSEAECRE